MIPSSSPTAWTRPSPRSTRRGSMPSATGPRRSRSCCIPASSPRVSELAFGVYVHWPFCAAKCPYCDFNSHVHRGAFDEAAYVEAYKLEIGHFARLTKGRTVQSIFFGGGTPSLMDPRSVAQILETIGQYWNIAPKAEITLEANPTSVEADRFRGYRAAGVNRVSLGVQSL